MKSLVSFIEIAGLFVSALILGTIIAAGEWNEKRKARRAGHEWEGAE